MIVLVACYNYKFFFFFSQDVPGKVGTPKARDVGRNWVSLHWAKPQHMGSVVVNAYKVEGWILGEEARWQEVSVGGDKDSIHLNLVILLRMLYRDVNILQSNLSVYLFVYIPDWQSYMDGTGRASPTLTHIYI